MGARFTLGSPWHLDLSDDSGGVVTGTQALLTRPRRTGNQQFPAIAPGRPRFHRHRAFIEVVSCGQDSEVAAGAQDAVLGGVQAAFRARDPAGRLPEREDAIPLPLFVCPCQEGTVLFRRLPGMGVHGFTSLRWARSRFTRGRCC